MTGLPGVSWSPRPSRTVSNQEMTDRNWFDRRTLERLRRVQGVQPIPLLLARQRERPPARVPIRRLDWDWMQLELEMEQRREWLLAA